MGLNAPDTDTFLKNDFWGVDFIFLITLGNDIIIYIFIEAEVRLYASVI